jgi:hypothetical protein
MNNLDALRLWLNASGYRTAGQSSDLTAGGPSRAGRLAEPLVEIARSYARLAFHHIEVVVGATTTQGTLAEQTTAFMCQPCDMDAPVLGDTGQEEADFVDTLRNAPIHRCFPKSAHEKAR